MHVQDVHVCQNQYHYLINHMDNKSIFSSIILVDGNIGVMLLYVQEYLTLYLFKITLRHTVQFSINVHFDFFIIIFWCRFSNIICLIVFVELRKCWQNETNGWDHNYTKGYKSSDLWIGKKMIFMLKIKFCIS